jgi:hypothetical protein
VELLLIGQVNYESSEVKQCYLELLGCHSDVRYAYSYTVLSIARYLLVSLQWGQPIYILNLTVI